MSSSIAYKCKPRQARDYIIRCLEAGLVPYLVGSPGGGKSAIVRKIGKDFKLLVIDHRASTMDPTDATGLPFFENGRAKFMPFTELFPTEDMEIPKGYNGWLLFLDELPSAPRAVQAALYKIILDRMVGQYKLHPNVFIVAAGNLATDRAIVNPIGTAMQSRLIHLELEVDKDQWLADVALPEEYDSRIIAFLNQFESKLMDFRPDHMDRTFPCPRTWEFANKLIKGREISENDIPLLAGTISSGVAVEFVQFCQVYKDLVPISEIVKDPENCKVPQDLSLKWATISNMMEKVDDENFEAFCTYANRFDLSFRILFYRSVLVRNADLRTHPYFGKAAADLSRYLNDSKAA